MSNEHVLVVDDTEMNVKLLTVLLSVHGYRVQSAASAEEAIPLLAATKFDLLLLDLSLPGMDGISFTRVLRRNPAHANLVIVAVTANAMKGDMEVALAAGFDAYVTKPIDTRAFPALVADAITRRR